MPPVGFEPTVSAGERPQAYALDRAATGTGFCNRYCNVLQYRLLLHLQCVLFSLPLRFPSPQAFLIPALHAIYFQLVSPPLN